MDFFSRQIARFTNPVPAESRSASYSIGDPALAEFLGLGAGSAAGQTVTESTSLGLTAVYRSVNIIAGTIASLPLKSYRTLDDGSRERVSSFLDDPGGSSGITPFEWVETILAHLLLHGNAYLLKERNEGGALIGLRPIHPRAVSLTEDPSYPERKRFTVAMENGEPRDFSVANIEHIPGLSTDGLKGLSPLTIARNAIGTGLAGDVAAGRMFKNGLLISGLVHGDENLSPEQADQIKAGIRKASAGAENAGDILVVNRDLKFDKWSMTAEDAQFIESRGFQIDEVARIFGVPKVLLNQDGASTWGSGIAELVRGLHRFTFLGWTSRIEQRLSRLLARPRFCEFDFAGLFQGSPAEVTANLAAEIEAGLLTKDEGRRILNRPPLPAAATPEVTDV